MKLLSTITTVIILITVVAHLTLIICVYLGEHECSAAGGLPYQQGTTTYCYKGTK